MLASVAILAVFVIILVWPTMWAAKNFGAERHSLGASLVTAIVSIFGGGIVSSGISNEFIAWIVAFFVGVIAVKYILIAKLSQSIVISIAITLIHLLIGWVFSIFLPVY